jgi:hypothetical protein
LGCGDRTPKQWLNVDYSLGSRLSKIPLFGLLNRYLHLFDIYWNSDIVTHDLRRRFPWKDQEIDIIYSSHTLEHLSREEGFHFLKECHRVLKKSGIIRIVVPDLRSLVDDYISGTTRADNFVESLGVLKESGLKGLLAPFNHVPHKCMYDAETLLFIMREIGFTCEKSQSFCSRIGDIDQVELQHRTENAVIVEGEKAELG